MKTLKKLIKEEIEAIKVDAVIEKFIKFAKKKWKLDDARLTINLCEKVSREFAKLAIEHGFEVEQARLEWSYLGEDDVALGHEAVVIDGKIYDFTATQFFGAGTKIPEIFNSIEEWAESCDETWNGKYDFPNYYATTYDDL